MGKGLTLVEYCRDLFLNQLVKERPACQTEAEFLDDLFGMEIRHIVECTSTKEFQMPGFYLGTDGTHKQVPKDLFFRTVKKGEALLVRHDKREDYIEIERYAGDVYRISWSEWPSVKRVLKVRGAP